MMRLLVALAALALLVTGCGSSDAKPTATKTVTATPTAAPQACLDAIEAAREVDGGLTQALSDGSRYPEMIGEVAQATADADNAKLEELLAELRSITAKHEAGVMAVGEARSAFEAAAAACEG